MNLFFVEDNASANTLLFLDSTFRLVLGLFQSEIEIRLFQLKIKSSTLIIVGIAWLGTAAPRSSPPRLSPGPANFIN